MRADRYTETPGAHKPKKKRKSRALRVLFLLIFILLVSIPLLIHHAYKSAESALHVSFVNDNPDYEVGSNVPLSDCIASYDGDLEVEGDIAYGEFDEILDTGTTGSKEISCTVSRSLYGGLLKPSREYVMSYTVSDHTPPLVLWSGDGSVIKLGTEFDIKDVIAYGDNSDPAPEVTVDGSVDMDTEGTYPLHVTVTDASGNSVDWDMSVIVSDVIPSYSDSSLTEPFSDFKSAYAGEGRSFGIDVSTWQGDIDFDAVKKAGCEFVMIRIGYSHEGDVTIDDKFRQNFDRAKSAGLKVGVYLYSYDSAEDAVRASADWIVNHLAGAKLELPIVFDWEDFGRFHTYGISFMELNRLYDAFADEVAKAGYDAMLYGSKTYLEKIWTDTDIRSVWLAHYTDETDYKGPYRIWQASSSGRINGISGAVDMNVMYE